MAASEMRRPFAVAFEHLVAQISQRPVAVQLDLEGQDFFLRAAANRQHAVRRDLRRRLAVLARTS